MRQFHHFEFLIEYKPGEIAFHKGIMQLVEVNRVEVILSEDGHLVRYIVRDTAGFTLTCRGEMLANREDDKYYLQNPLRVF